MNTKKIANEHYIESFEGGFSTWVEDKARVVTSGNNVKDLKAPVQALVNAYHDEKGGLDPVQIPNFNTLQLFILVSGASKSHSGENESLNILDSAMNQ